MHLLVAGYVYYVFLRYCRDFWETFTSLHSCPFNTLTLILSVFSMKTSKPLEIRSLPAPVSQFTTCWGLQVIFSTDVVVEVYDSTQPSAGLYSTEFTEKPVWSLLCGLVQLQRPNQSAGQGRQIQDTGVSVARRRISWLKPKFWLF